MRDNIRNALTAQLKELSAATSDTSPKKLIAAVVKGLETMRVGLDEAGREAMVVVLARHDQAMFEAVAMSQRAVLLSAILIALTVLAAGTLVVPMAWLYTSGSSRAPRFRRRRSTPGSTRQRAADRAEADDAEGSGTHRGGEGSPMHTARKREGRLREPPLPLEDPYRAAVTETWR